MQFNLKFVSHIFDENKQRIILKYVGFVFDYILSFCFLIIQ